MTITAKSTANPSVSATATVNIVTAVPIVVSISPPPAPAQATATQAPLAATVTGDPGNLGVDWTASCGSAGGCGSFNLSPAHTASGGQIVYTAPATVPSGGLVTITAASSASSASSAPVPANPGIAFITIIPTPPSVSFQQAPPSAMTSVTQAAVSATVANDVSPGGVTWSVQCASTLPAGCGWVLPQQTASGATATYTAPPVTSAETPAPVTLIATSVADPSASVSSNPITINPATTPSISFIPLLPSQMQPNATVNLTAAVANDATHAGIDWQVCASGCGFFTITPAIPAITTTTPAVPAVPAVTATSALGWSNGLPIAYTAPSQLPSAGDVAILATAHADNKAATSGTITISSSAAGPPLNGVVEAGVQPVVGASVSLYAAGTGGYASAASSLATVVSDKNGDFTIPGTYSCPSPGSQMYLVATGGESGSNAANPNLALMTVLGSCSNLGSTQVVVNEVTTVASAFATSPFASNDTLTGNKSYLYLGTSAGNSAGLANAFAAAANLADITTGQARFVVPVGNAAVPYTTINVLADLLNSCTATSGGSEGDNSSCGTLFADTDLIPGGVSVHDVAPTDTLQAAFNIAQHPVANYGYALSLPIPVGGPSDIVSSSSPFQPAVPPSHPDDWSLSLNYALGDLPSADTPGAFAIDAAGNLWITETKAGTVLEWNSTGAALSPATGYPAGGGPIAIDANGNVWISGNHSLSELTSLGIPMPGSPFAGVPAGGTDVAIDAQGSLWIANGGGVSEFSDLGVELSPAGGYINSELVDVDAVGIDSSDNVWLGMLATSQSVFAIVANPGGQLIIAGGSNSIGNVLPQMAADSAGDMWAVTPNNICKAPPYAGKGSIFNPSSSSCTDSTIWPFDNSQGIAVDGTGVAWVASAGGGFTPPILPSVLPIVLGGTSNPMGYYASSSLAAGPLRLGVDGSGNVWVLLADNSITEYVGTAAPTTNPIALALKSKKIGAKP